MLSEDASPSKQCVAICFEGLCASVNLATYTFESNTEVVNQAFIRANFIEALDSFKKATNNAITILLYTFLGEDKLSRVLTPELMAQLSVDNLINRIIYLEGYRLGVYPEKELIIPRSYLPEGTSEILWIHPLDIDFNEVLSRVKTKKYERLLYDESEISGIRTVTCLPRITATSGGKDN